MQTIIGTCWLCLALGLCLPFMKEASCYGSAGGNRGHTPSNNRREDNNDYYHKNELGQDLIPLIEWSQLEFDYESPGDRQRDIDNGIFIPGVPAPIDVDLIYLGNQRSSMFVTIPRFQPGSPITLGKLTNQVYGGNPVLTPYPSWSWHTDPERCKRDRIVSVYRVEIDECGRLWVLDNGRFGNNLTCPPQLLVFDPKTDKLIHRYEIPASQVESRSIFVTLIVDVRDYTCMDTFVYLADCQTYSLVVYDYRRDTSWKITDKTMYPFPTFGTYNILGDSFDLMDGILGMTLSPFKPGEDRILYYHAMSSNTENYVLTSHLRNESMFYQNPLSSPQIFTTYRSHRISQSAAEAMDKDGILYFGDMSDVTIKCWNSKSDYRPSTIDVIANNKQKLQFASGIKVITNTRGDQELYVLTSRFQKVATNTINTSETNFRILAGSVKGLIQSSKCRDSSSEPSQLHQHHHHRPPSYERPQYQENVVNSGGGYGPRPKPSYSG